MIRKIILSLSIGLIVQFYMPSAGLTLQWPSPSSRITAGYGYRIHPVYGMSSIKRLWHNGIDISTNKTSVKLKAVVSGKIERIDPDDKISGNRVKFGGWQYLHLSGNNPPNWEFGDATGWNEEDEEYNLPVKYFAIQDGNTKIYYSTNPKIYIDETKEEKDARTSITESDFIVYSGNTGLGTGYHLHLINYNGGDPTKSPLINLYDARRDDPHGYILPWPEFK